MFGLGEEGALPREFRCQYHWEANGRNWFEAVEKQPPNTTGSLNARWPHVC